MLLATGLEDAAGSREDSITNADAERVLLRVKQKLEGLEGGALAVILEATMLHALLCIWCLQSLKPSPCRPRVSISGGPSLVWGPVTVLKVR